METNDIVAASNLSTTTQHSEQSQKIYPASDSQQRLWFIHQLLPLSPVYNIYRAIQIDGDLNVEALSKTVNKMIERHEALRTTFFTEKGRVLQRIHGHLTIPLPVHDLVDQQAQIQPLLDRNIKQPFDLINGPIIRVCLIKIAENTHIFHFMVHHIAFDRRSLGLLNKEITELYRFYADGVPAKLPELEVQYSDYSLWRLEKLKTEDLSRQWKYWEKQLASVTPLALPYDKARASKPTTEGERVYLDIPSELIEKFEAVVVKQGATMFMGLLAVFKTLIYRWSGETDILAGTPFADRRMKGTDDLFGFFVSTLVLRTDLSGDPTFDELLARVKKTCFNAYRFNSMPLDKIIENLNPERSVNRNPLFDLEFQIQKLQPEVLELGDAALSEARAARNSSQYDLTLTIREKIKGYDIRFEYRSDLFERSTIELLLKRFQILLESIVENTKLEISRYSIVLPDEKQKLLKAWNDTDFDYQQDKCLHTLFEEQVYKTPDNIALEFDNQQLTYRQLNEKANQLAHYLRSKGVTKEVMVGVCTERSIEMVVALYAIIKAGGGYVPLDPDYPSARLAFMLEDINATIILTQTHLKHLVPQSKAELVCLDSADFSVAEYSIENPLLVTQTDNLAYVIYTSGSTGNPKGVMNCHNGIVNRLLWMQQAYQIGKNDNVLQKTPYSFDVSVWEFFWPLIVGAKLVVAKPGGHQDAVYLAELIQTKNITTLHFVPSMLQIFVDKAVAENCQSIQKVFCSGEALPYELQQQFFKFCGAELHNLYGPTEAAVDVTYWQCNAEYSRKIVPIGRPVANTQIYVLDKWLCPVPVGTSGELHIGGIQVARGYLNRPELNAEKFIADPFSEDPKARLYKTGDSVRFLSDGQIEYLGRIDFQVKIRGLRIELGEIENAIVEFDAIKQCVVVVREDKPGDKRIVAYFETKNDLLVKADDLRKQLRHSLPSYMVPQFFVELDSLPLSPNGKIDRKALPSPSAAGVDSQTEIVLATTASQKALVSMWQELIGVENISIDASFFEIGGHSLLAMQMISMIATAYGFEIPLSVVFENPRINELAEYIDNNKENVEEVKYSSLIEHFPQRTASELSFAQKRLWFLDQLSPHSPLYNVPVFIKLTGTVLQAEIQNFFSELVQKHQILTSSFADDGAGPKQIHNHLGAIEVKPVDFSKHSQAQIDEFLTEEYVKPFDLSKSPLFRIHLVRTGERETILCLVIHHIIFDGWSINILLQELKHYYLQSQLKPVDIQYADFAEWHNRWVSAGAIAKQQAVWMNILKGELPILSLPEQLPRPPVQSINGAIVQLDLDRKVFTQIQRESQKHGVTPFMYLLSVYVVALHRYSSQEDIIVGTPIANRNNVQSEPLIGFFVNTLPLRLFINKSSNFAEFLGLVKNACLVAYDNQDVPFEKLVADLNPVRDVSRTPIFQTIFNYLKAADSNFVSEDIDAKVIPWGGSISKTDLTLTVTERTANYQLAFEYCSDLFEQKFMANFLQNIGNILNVVLTDDKQKLNEIEFLAEVEMRQLIEQRNQTEQVATSQSTMLSMFQQQVGEQPDATAVITENASFTYAQINQQALVLANHLIAQGVLPDQMVAILLTRSELLPVTMLAIFYAGATYLPLDPEYPQQRIQYILQDAKVSHIILEDSLYELVADEKATKVNVREVFENQHDDQALTTKINTSSLAYVIYTSGSTGNPKGVMIKQQNLTNFLSSMARVPGLTRQDTILAVTTISFDIAVLEILLPLSVGASSVIVNRTTSYDPIALTRLLNQHDVTLMQATPSTWQMLLAAQWKGKSNLKVLTGGESLPQSLSSQLFPIVAEVWNMYGPTETTVWSTCYRIKNADDVPLIGKPIDNTQVYILDENQKLVPDGVLGELCIGGEGVTKGYLGRQDLTDEKFIANPFSKKSDDFIYRTGDQVRYVTGNNIEYISRLDFQVKVRGYRIELGEIETALNQFDGVEQSVVIVREDKQNDKRIVAYYISRKNLKLDTAKIRLHMNACLPGYMVPQSFEMLETFPLTPNGKIDRKSLPLPAKSEAEDTRNLEKPKTKSERELAKLWKSIIGIDAVYLESNFFEVGGHSLLATQLVYKIATIFNVEMPLSQVFSYPVFSQQISFIENNHNGSFVVQTIEPSQRNRQQPTDLSYSQLRLWLLEKLEPTNLVYNMPVILKLAGEVDRKLLEKCVKDFVQRHASMRTTFQVLQSEKPMQIIHQTMGVNINYLDFSDKFEFDLDEYFENSFSNTCNLIDGPLFRFELIRLKKDVYVLAAFVHHIIFDGWSSQILVREISEQYASLIANQAYTPVLSLIDYTDFAKWHNEWIESQKLEQQKSFWSNYLSGELPVLEIPTQFARPPIQSFNGKRIGIKLDDAIFDKVQALAQELDVTPFMIFIAAYYALLHSVSGQRDIIIGAPIANRNRPEVECVVGCFVNTVSLRTTVDNKLSFKELLVQVRNNCLLAFDNQDLPFERIVSQLVSKRELDRTPVFQTTFNFQERPDNRVIGNNVELSIYPWSRSVAKTDTSLSVIRQNKSYSIYLEYSIDLFEESYITELLNNYQSLFERFLRDQSSPLKNYQLMNTLQQNELRHRWNQTERKWPQLSGVHQIIEELAEHPTQKIAVQSEQGAFSYQSLNESANQFARYLQNWGVQNGDKVGILADFSFEMLSVIIGVFKSGAIVVPLDFDDPRARLNTKITQGQLKLVVSQNDVSDRIDKSMKNTLLISELEAITSGFEKSNLANDFTTHPCAITSFISSDENELVSIYTDHLSLLNRLFWTREYIQANFQDVVLLQDPLSSPQAITALILAWSAGAQVVVIDADQRRNVEFIANAIQENNVTIAAVDEDFLQECIGANHRKEFSSVEKFMMSGDFLSHAIQVSFKEFSHAELHFIYGSCETSGQSTHWKANKDLPTKRKQIGRPITNTQAFILDNELLEVPIGATGELYIGGISLSSKGSTNQHYDRRFSDVCLQSVDGNIKLFKTGDVARYLMDGRIQFVKSCQERVTLRGHQIHLKEISNTISSFENVTESIVVLNQEHIGNKRLVAYFTTKDGQSSCKETLRTQISEILPSYMIPSIFVELISFPRDGKLQIEVSRLPKLTQLKIDSQQILSLPRSELEKSIALIWQELLDVEEVTIYDNFIELGGHSFLALQAISQVKQRLNIDLTPLSMIRDNLEQIAASIEGAVTLSAEAPINTSFENVRPFYFGENNSLFGSYHSPALSKKILGAVLLCSPIYMEQINAHWAYRRLASQLSSAGFHVLRFDYYATGDSLGEDQDANLSIWIKNIDAAAQQLLSLSNSDSISLVGLRFGATLAAMSSVKNVNRLVLWEPVISGENYVKDLHKKYLGTLKELNIIRKSPAQAKAHELVGFQFPESIANSLQQVELAHGACLGSAAKVSIITSNEFFMSQSQINQLKTKNAHLNYCYVEDTSPALESYTDLAAYLPGKSLNAIVNQLKEKQ